MANHLFEERWQKLLAVEKQFETTIRELNVALNNLSIFSDEEFVGPIFKRVEAITADAEDWEGQISDYKQLIENRQALIHNRRLVREKKYTLADFERTVMNLALDLERAKSRGDHMSNITRLGVEQMLAVTHLPFNAMVERLGWQNENDQRDMEELELVLAEHCDELRELKGMITENHRTQKKRVKGDLAEAEQKISDHRMKKLRWATQDEEHEQWIQEFQQDFYALHRSSFAPDRIAPAVVQLPPHRRKKRKKKPLPQTSHVNSCTKEECLWSFLAVENEHDAGRPMPLKRDDFLAAIKTIANKKNYWKLNPEIVFDKLHSTIEMSVHQRQNIGPIFGRKFHGWQEMQVGYDYRMLMLFDEIKHCIRFFLFAKKKHKQVLSQ